MSKSPPVYVNGDVKSIRKKGFGPLPPVTGPRLKGPESTVTPFGAMLLAKFVLKLPTGFKEELSSRSHML
jgi:hypothetical protein